MSGFGNGWGGTPCTEDVDDTARPTVENFVPIAQTPITHGTPIEFDIVFTLPLVALVVSVVYRDTGATEVVYNSDGFTTNFRTTVVDGALFVGSERQVTSGNNHFILRRRSGWPFSPSVMVEGADEGGKAIAA